MGDRPLVRFTPPHEPDHSDLVLSAGEKLPGFAVKRALDALLACTASLQDPGGRFIAVRPQPGIARRVLENFLERVLDAEVPGRSDPSAVKLSGFPLTPDTPTRSEFTHQQLHANFEQAFEKTFGEKPFGPSAAKDSPY